MTPFPESLPQEKLDNFIADMKDKRDDHFKDFKKQVNIDESIEFNDYIKNVIVIYVDLFSDNQNNKSSEIYSLTYKGPDGETIITINENVKNFIEYLQSHLKSAENEQMPTTSNNNMDLIDAARKGYKDTVELLLKEDADVNAKDAKGNTALMLASKRGHNSIVKALLKKGADVNAKNSDGNTALMLAKKALMSASEKALMSAEKGYKKVVETLINNGAKEVRMGVDNMDLITAAREGKTEVVNALLANVDANTDQGSRALIVASQNGHESIVEALLKAAADVNATDKDGNTALMFASNYGHDSCVRSLLKAGADKEATGKIASSWASPSS